MLLHFKTKKVILVSQTKKAPAGLPSPGARPKEAPLSAEKSSVHRPTEGEESSADTHPHACTDGIVYLTYTAFDEEIGDEVERIEAAPCRRCQEAKESERTEITRAALSFLLRRVATDEDDHNERGKALLLLEELRA